LAVTTPAISALGVSKGYGGEPVLRDLTLRIAAGSCYGLLGRNGAGKSTLLHLLLGLLRPERGEIRVLASPPGRALRRVGYLPERARYHTQFSPREYLRALASASCLPSRHLAGRSNEVLALVGLSADADRRLGTFSKGMLQRFGIAQSLLGDPELLLIDEPTSGLDPAGQFEVLEILDRVRQRGHTILMCTHQIPETERLCDTVGVLSDGRLAAEARVADLATRGARIVVRADGITDEMVRGVQLVAPTAEATGREIRVRADEAEQQAALHALLDAGVAVAEFRPLVGGVQALYQDALADAADGTDRGDQLRAVQPTTRETHR
jgi:ABC-2 type transport system ATP-binding protein